jgi:membrane protease YdiL (CAAX protease family)
MMKMVLLRLLVLFLFILILLIGIAMSYYTIVNCPRSGISTTLASVMKLFCIYAVLLDACLFVALVWLVADESKIRRLTKPAKSQVEADS